VVCDLDGTLYLGSNLLPGALRFIDAVRESGRHILFLTNNSSRNTDAYRRKLAGMGVDAAREEIMTSTDATVDYLREHHEGATLMLLGTRDFESEIEAVGFTHVRHENDRPEVVVVAFDTGMTYDKMRAACRSIDRGAAFIATHPDLACPDTDGPVPDCGAMCAMITAATGVEPTVVGKPYRPLLDTATRRFGVDAQECAIVGDRLYTDIQMGVDFGLLTVLVLSGETTRGMLAESPVRPDTVVNGIGDLADSLREHPYTGGK
jgi:4-nitrophenyl phosphatase